MVSPIINHIIDKLYQWVTSYKDRELIKDTTRVNCKFDAFIQSNISDPLNFTIFEMTDKGELIVDDIKRLVESEAAFYLFINTETNWIVAVKNNTKNQAKLARREPVEHFKVKIIN